MTGCRIKIVGRRIALVFASFIALEVAHPSHAAIVITGQQVNSDIVITSTGSLNLDGLSKVFFNVEAKALFGDRNLVIGKSPAEFIKVNQYQGFDLPVGFQPTGSPTGGSGPRWGFSKTTLLVPDGYESGDPLNATSVFAGQTIQSLNLRPGTYTWKLPNDSVTLQVVPLPAALPLLASGLLGLGFVQWRRQKKKLPSANVR